VEPEESNIARQRLGKQVSEATDTQATIHTLLETMFSIRSVQNGYSLVENRQSSSGVPSEQLVEDLGSAREAEKVAL
jgi:hypothetical protein